MAEDRLTDERGVLGNLPRSRPGRRSDRRVKGGDPRESKDAGASRATRAQSRSAPAGAAGTRGASASRAARAPRSRPSQPTAAGARRPETGRPASDEDLVAATARAAAGVTLAGVRVASRLAGEALRRLPRP